MAALPDRRRRVISLIGLAFILDCRRRLCTARQLLVVAAAGGAVAAVSGDHAGRPDHRQPVDQLDAGDLPRAAGGHLRDAGRRPGPLCAVCAERSAAGARRVQPPSPRSGRSATRLASAGWAVRFCGPPWRPRPGWRGARAPQIADGRRREGSAILAATLLVLEMWVAEQYLGTLMIVTLIVMIVLVLDGTARCRHLLRRTTWKNVATRNASPWAYRWWACSCPAPPISCTATRRGPTRAAPASSWIRRRGQELPDKSHPGPGWLRATSGGPADSCAPPWRRTRARSIGFLPAIHLLNRNYTYDFHNELFLRTHRWCPTIVRLGSSWSRRPRRFASRADEHTRARARRWPPATRWRGCSMIFRAYLAFNFDRAPVLEQMSAGFERTEAGLQHAAHLYEGESKVARHRPVGHPDEAQRVIDDPGRRAGHRGVHDDQPRHLRGSTPTTSSASEPQ